ncbi:hypothetical protein C2S53_011483 [Perilla frutescens var. hirtella]|uniref:Uncharacterized protein n=1 Tax=Perilla frutescens var. hirtella TaxID=608512 RepID=A0AAD4JAA3_PERFH|nr:hypothetical protein C2S53_011483 [Perilla frutescens var. hirtella]
MLPRGILGWSPTVIRPIILNRIPDEPVDGMAADSENHHRRFPTVKRRSNTFDEANRFSHSIIELGARLEQGRRWQWCSSSSAEAAAAEEAAAAVFIPSSPGCSETPAASV